MKNETIINIVFIVAVSAILYYLYKKITTQQEIITHLSKKCDDLELLFKPVAPESDLNTIYNTHADESNECSNGLCDLQPMNIQTDNNQFEMIAMVELEKVKQKKKSSRISSIHSSRRSSISIHQKDD